MAIYSDPQKSYSRVIHEKTFFPPHRFHQRPLEQLRRQTSCRWHQNLGLDLPLQHCEQHAQRSAFEVTGVTRFGLLSPNFTISGHSRYNVTSVIYISDSGHSTSQDESRGRHYEPHLPHLETPSSGVDDLPRICGLLGLQQKQRGHPLERVPEGR